MYIFDHKKRIKRLQESLKIAGTGTAVVVLPSNIRYLTGFWGYAARAEYFEPRRLICLVSGNLKCRRGEIFHYRQESGSAKISGVLGRGWPGAVLRMYPHSARHDEPI